MKNKRNENLNKVKNEGLQKPPKIIELLQNSFTYSDYTQLRKELNITGARFSRIEKSGVFTFGELSKLLPLVYKRFSISALIPEPKDFVVLYEQNHLTLEEVEKLQNLGS